MVRKETNSERGENPYYIGWHGGSPSHFSKTLFIALKPHVNGGPCRMRGHKDWIMKSKQAFLLLGCYSMCPTLTHYSCGVRWRFTIHLYASNSAINAVACYLSCWHRQNAQLIHPDIKYCWCHCWLQTLHAVCYVNIFHKLFFFIQMHIMCLTAPAEQDNSLNRKMLHDAVLYFKALLCVHLNVILCTLSRSRCFHFPCKESIDTILF